MSSVSVADFEFERLPLELQRKVLDRYYDDPFKICASLGPRNAQFNRPLNLSTTLQIGPLGVSRVFRREALSALYSSCDNILVWSASQKRIDLLQIPTHFQRLCLTVSVLVIDKNALWDLEYIRPVLPSLSLIEPTHHRSKGPISSARIVIESSSSIFPVLQGSLDDKFKAAAIENTKNWLNPWHYVSMNVPVRLRYNLENLAFGIPVQFDAAAIWQAEDESFCFPGSSLVCIQPHSQYNADDLTEILCGSESRLLPYSQEVFPQKGVRSHPR